MKADIPAKVVDLWQNPYYRDIIATIEELRPLPVRYDPKMNNVEEMKFNSAQIQAYELVLLVLKPKSTGET